MSFSIGRGGRKHSAVEFRLGFVSNESSHADQLAQSSPVMSPPAITTDKPTSSKKRKAVAVADQSAAEQDGRFAFTAADLADDDDDGQNEDSAFYQKQSTLPAHLLPASASSSKNKSTPGLIYLSRIPPGMGPSKVKHLLGAYGEVGRVYLARDGAYREFLRVRR